MVLPIPCEGGFSLLLLLCGLVDPLECDTNHYFCILPPFSCCATVELDFHILSFVREGDRIRPSATRRMTSNEAGGEGGERESVFEKVRLRDGERGDAIQILERETQKRERKIERGDSRSPCVSVTY